MEPASDDAGADLDVLEVCPAYFTGFFFRLMTQAGNLVEDRHDDLWRDLRVVAGEGDERARVGQAEFIEAGRDAGTASPEPADPIGVMSRLCFLGMMLFCE